MSQSTKGGDLFIVDNSDSEWKGLRYLQEWTEIATSFDIATGFFEIGAFLALDGKWQKRAHSHPDGRRDDGTDAPGLLDVLRQRVCQKLDAI